MAASCVNGRGLVTFEVTWQAGGWVGEYHGGRETNASMTYYVAEHVMVNPLQMKDNVGERRGGKRQTQGLGGTHDQMEVCLDENGFLRSGQFKRL